MLKSIKDIFNPNPNEKLDITPGIYHYQSDNKTAPNHRFHLRVETNGSGLLILDASTVLHLNQTATQFAYFIVKGLPDDMLQKTFEDNYLAPTDQILSDFNDFKNQIFTLLETPDLDPVITFGYADKLQYSEDFSAPYRLDIALTYEIQNESEVYGQVHKRVDKELSTEEWKSVIDRAWGFGIPQIVFTGGEPTLRDDLVELIQHAENNGQVTGLITNGFKLADQEYLNSLLQAGLDHTMIVLEPKNELSWNSLSSFNYWKNVLDENLFVSAHLTITDNNHEEIIKAINELSKTEVSAISLSTSDKKFDNLLEECRELVADLDTELLWDLPVPYSNQNPVALELQNAEAEKSLKGAGKAWLYIEPDGDVLPEQSINEILGNILTSDWKSIWKKSSQR